MWCRTYSRQNQFCHSAQESVQSLWSAMFIKFNLHFFSIVLMYEFILAFTWIIYLITVFQIFFLSGVGRTIFGVGHTSSEFNWKNNWNTLDHSWNTTGTLLEHPWNTLEHCLEHPWAIMWCPTDILYDFYIFVLVLYQLEMMKLNKYPFKILCPLEIKAPYTLKYFWMSELTKILINVCGVRRTQTKSLLPLRTRECSISVKCYVHQI